MIVRLSQKDSLQIGPRDSPARRVALKDTYQTALEQQTLPFFAHAGRSRGVTRGRDAGCRYQFCSNLLLFLLAADEGLVRPVSQCTQDITCTAGVAYYTRATTGAKANPV